MRMREFLVGLAIIFLAVPYRVVGPAVTAWGSDGPDTPEYDVTEMHGNALLAQTDIWYVRTFNGPPGIEDAFRVFHVDVLWFGQPMARFLTVDVFRERPDELAGGGDTPAWNFMVKGALIGVRLRLLHGPNFFRLSVPPCCEAYDLGLLRPGAVSLDWDEYDGWGTARWP